jgi:hypothetical protein
MSINSATFNVNTGHTYKYFEKNDPMLWQNRFNSADSTPIGLMFDAKAAPLKSDELKQMMANVDLRHISPHELMRVGGYLQYHGEISDNAEGEFAVLQIAKDGMDPNAPIDAIKFYEERYSIISDLIDKGEKGLDDAKDFLGNVLHTLYNMDDFIHSIRSGGNIDISV